MTRFLFDLSRHQAERSTPPDLALALRAGFGIVNIALDRGRQEDVLPAWAASYASWGRSLGMGISTYRWLDNRLGGEESARRAFDRMLTLGGGSAAGMAHIVDVEDNATEQIVRDYLITIQALLGRPVALYTGDWWWTAQGRNWPMSGLTPYLHAAPNAGYLSAYPGDSSTAWNAGYGGWPQLAVMQYAVAPLPGTGDCSLSAIRTPGIWTTLTGGTDVGAYEDWVNSGKPVTGIARPIARIGQRLRVYGYTVYNIGNQAHLVHLPPEDHTPFSGTGWPVASPRWWIFAMDIMPPPAGSPLPTLAQISNQMLADAKAGIPGATWLKYMNHEPNGPGGICVQDRFMPTYERRSSSDRGHIHASGRSDCKDWTSADDYDPVARFRAGGSPPAPPPVPAKGNHVLTIVHDTVGGGYYVSDGMTLRGIPNWTRMLAIQAAGKAGEIGPMWNNAAIKEAADIGVYGVTPLSPVAEFTDAQVAALAAALAAADNGLPADPQAIADALRPALSEIVVAGVKQAAREGTGVNSPPEG